MAQELTHTRTGNTLRYKQADLPSGLYRILIPAGTLLWQVGINTYLSDEPASAYACFDKPPAEPYEDAGVDTRTVLERMWRGATLSFYGLPGAGALTMSQPERPSTFRADRDRWLYVQFNFPAGRALAVNSIIELHADAAPAPAPAQPEPSLELAQRTLDYAHRAGLVKALMLTAGARNDDELINWMLRQGDLWFSLCRMVGLAEQGKT